MRTKNNFKSIMTIMLLLISVFSAKAQQNINFGKITYNNAINIAGKQRMLSQKMAKAYLYLISNPTDSKAKKDLLTSKILFERQNSFLLQNSRNKTITSNIEEVDKLFVVFKALLETTPGYTNAEKITELNTDLLMATDKTTSSIMKTSKMLSTQTDEEALGDNVSASDKLELQSVINAAGRQRMLSQRLALYYYANSVMVNEKNVMRILKNTFNEVEGTLMKLMVYELNTPEIDEKIGLALTKWNKVETQKEKLLTKKLDKAEVYKLSDDLTRVFNDITNLYEKITL